MSEVRKRNRKVSSIQYIDTARELVVHTVHCCKKFPKSVMFFYTKEICDTAREIYKNVCRANAIIPKCALDVELRYKFLKSTLGIIDALDGLLGIADEDIGDLKDSNGKLIISDYGWVHWGELMEKETNLIKAVLQSDAKLTF